MALAVRGKMRIHKGGNRHNSLETSPGFRRPDHAVVGAARVPSRELTERAQDFASLTPPWSAPRESTAGEWNE